MSFRAARCHGIAFANFDERPNLQFRSFYLGESDCCGRFLDGRCVVLSADGFLFGAEPCADESPCDGEAGWFAAAGGDNRGQAGSGELLGSMVWALPGRDSVA